MKKIKVADIAAVAAPGDTLVVGFNRRVSDEEFDLMREQWGDVVGESGVRLVAFDGVVSLVVVRGPGLDTNGAVMER